MPLIFETLDAIRTHGFDTVIDVRSPAEFAIDHIPGAINLPSLSNEERAEVGTMYKQVSPFKARKLGASLVLKNVADHIAGPLQPYDGSWQPLVYCWRGGQRSGVFSTLLKEIGWRADTIKGGYQTYRRLVQTSLYDAVLSHKFVLLDGYTGTAKTAVLNRLHKFDVQTIDLEGLARHRGSLLGEMPGGQPSQRMFETNLANALAACDPDKVTVLEAESSKIGRVSLPPSLWNGMIAAPRIQINVPLEERVDFITQEYKGILADPQTVSRRLKPLSRVRGHAIVGGWQSMQAEGDLKGFAKSLICDHYDPAYATSQKRREHEVLATVSANALNAAGQDELASKIAEALRSP